MVARLKKSNDPLNIYIYIYIYEKIKVLSIIDNKFLLMF